MFLGLCLVRVGHGWALVLTLSLGTQIQDPIPGYVAPAKPHDFADLISFFLFPSLSPLPPCPRLSPFQLRLSLRGGRPLRVL